MTTRALPPEAVMYHAFRQRDVEYDGVFVTGVRTTGIFCRPGCPARKPRRENLEFFVSPKEALHSGYRPCKRCRPLEPAGAPPDWLRDLLAEVESDPGRRWTDRDVRSRGLSPERVRRWFKSTHGMTFHAYSRARRLGAALGSVQGGEQVARAALDAGYESLSGFQHAFRQYFGDSPTSLDEATIVRVDRLSTPLGPMLVAATDEAVCLLEFADRRMLPAQVDRIRKQLGAVYVPDHNAVIDVTTKQIAQYFDRHLRKFTMPLTMPGTTFQHEVWQALRDIPYGETRTYAQVARAVGRPTAVRAVGRANGMNAIGIVVPCHRVLGADGKLVGYGGGLWRKRRLLALEAGAVSSSPTL